MMMYSQVDLLACPPVKLVYTSLKGIVIEPKLMLTKNKTISPAKSTENKIVFRLELFNSFCF